MNNNAILGWDIGGAHLKAVLVNEDGRAECVIQRPCPLWLGLDRLELAVGEVLAGLEGTPARHVVTMTGELADIFPDRASGVMQLTQCMLERLKGSEITLYAGTHGFVGANAVQAHLHAIASANWYASATFLAKRCSDAIFIDIGSTTSDLIVLAEGKPAVMGHSDAERLRSEELVYTGVVRTPVMAVARQLPFAGGRYPLAAEHFATTADVYRLTCELQAAYDMAETADGGGRTEDGSARRLARMIGLDQGDATMAEWRQLAQAVRSEQLRTLQSALERHLSRLSLPESAPFIGAGAGSFLARELARIMGRPYVDASSLIDADGPVAGWAGVCLPAYAVAWLRLKDMA